MRCSRIPRSIGTHHVLIQTDMSNSLYLFLADLKVTAARTTVHFRLSVFLGLCCALSLYFPTFLSTPSHPRQVVGHVLEAVSKSKLAMRLCSFTRSRETGEAGSQGNLAERGMLKVSLRSIGEEDTTVISEAYGGGGHRNASGCTMPLSEFDSWVVHD